MKKKVVGIYGGSFNPIHNGHVQLGDELVAQGAVNELWYVVSPQNPFKVNQQLMPDDLRLHLTNLALEGHKGLKVCDVEYRLPKPSYMFHTLEALRKENPEVEFRLVIGADNLERFQQWYRADDILACHKLIVYPRPGYPLTDVPSYATVAKTSLIDISSTQIREALKHADYNGEGLPTVVWNELKCSPYCIR